MRARLFRITSLFRMQQRWQPSARTMLLAAIAIFGIGTACAEGRLPTDPGHLSPSVRLSLNATVSSAGRAMKLTASYAQTTAPTVLIPFFTTTITLTGDETELPIRIDIAGCVADPARELPTDAPAADLAQTCIIHLALALLDADGKQIDAVVLPPIAAKPGAAIESPPVVLGSVVTSVSLLPRAATINAIGFTSRLTATVVDNFGAVITSAAVTWLSVDPAVATVDSTGIVTARAVGVTRIVATSREKVDTATVTVRQLIKSVTLTGAPASIQQGDSALVGAVVRDSADVVIPPTTAPVTFSSSDAAVLTVDANTGRVRAMAVGTASVRATAGAVTTSASILVRPIPIAKVVVSPASGSAFVGQTFQYLAQPQDAGGASLPGRVVTWSSSDTTIAAVSSTGLATARRAGVATITATSEGVLGTGTLTVTPAPATQLALATQPAGAVTGSVLSAQPVIQVKDASGGVVVGSSAAVTVALDGVGGTLAGTTTVNAVNGIATFTNLVVTGVGSYTLTFSSGALTPVTSSAISVAPLPATQLGIATQPGGAQTGSSLAPQPVVQVRNAAGGTVVAATTAITATLTGTGGALSGTTTVNAVNGVASFTDLVVTGAGTYSITFSGGGLTAATSASFAITAKPATQLAVSAQPGGAVTGSSLAPQPIVTVLDADGGVVAGSSAPVTALLVGSGGTLSGTTTVNAVNGVATFANLVVTGTGSYTLSFSSGALTAASSSAFTVSPLPATQVGIATQPGGAQTGSLLAPQPVVQLRNAQGGTVAGATNAVTVTLNGSGGTLAGTTTVNAVNGVATFSDLVVNGEGNFTLSFSSTGLTPVTSGSIALTPRPATQLGVATQPGGVQTGSALSPQPVVQVRNAIGGVVAGSTNAVTATLNGTGGTLTGTTTVNAVDGVATFTNLVVTGTGAYSLAFSATSLTGATSSTFGVTALAASQLVVATQPIGAISGSALGTQPVVNVRDASNSNVAGATNVVTAVLSSGTGTLTGTTSVAAVNGVATFTDLRITGAGTSAIVFTATGLASATSAAIVTAPLPATKLAIATQPGGANTGSALSPQPVVQVQDAGGGVVVGSGAAVTATLSGTGGTLSGATTVNAVNGVATFTDLVVAGVGSYTLSFSSGSLTGATSNTITISPLPATQLGIRVQPGDGITGSPLTTQPQVEFRDANGVYVPSINAVTAVLNGPGGTVTGNIRAALGYVTFTDLAVTGPGAYTLTFTAAGMSPVTSASFTVQPRPATQLVVATQPSGAVTDALLSAQPVVQVRDDVGTVVSGSSAPVTVALVGAGGTLSGTTTVNAVNGVATFSDLRISGVGTYTLSFSSGSLSSTTSGLVVISALPPALLRMVTQPVGAETGSPLTVQPVIQIWNNNESIVTDATNPVTVTLVGDGATLSGTTTVNAVGGIATFTDLVVTGQGAYELGFASGTLSPTTSTRIFITPRPPTQLVVTTQPGGTQTGTVLSVSPVVQVRDAVGAVVANSSDIVTATLNGTGGELSGTSVAAVNGVATFSNLIVFGAGTYTITFTSDALEAATSAGFTITPPPPATIGLVMGTAATVTGTVGTALDVPIVADMSNAQGQVLGALSLNITWDPTKFDFVSVTNGSFGTSPSYLVNTNNAIYGSIAVSMYAVTGFSTGIPTIYTVTLSPKSPSTTASVTSAVTAAGDDVGNSIPVSMLIVRPVAITTP